MQGRTFPFDPALTRWAQTLVGAVLFVAIGVFVQGVLLRVEYSCAPVLDDQTVAGRDAQQRAVLVETPERLRLVRAAV